LSQYDCCGKSAGYGFCSKCVKLAELSKHHVTPRRRFPPGRNSPLGYLCRSCHDVADDLSFVWEDYGRAYLIDQYQRWIRGELDEELSTLRKIGEAERAKHFPAYA